MNNEEKIKNYLSSEPVPEKISPENIMKMLDEKACRKKRSSIKKSALKITAGAAACAVICGTGVYAYNNHVKNSPDFFYESIIHKEHDCQDPTEASTNIPENYKENPVSSMKTSQDYSDIYSIIARKKAILAANRMKKTTTAKGEEDMVMEEAGEYEDIGAESSAESFYETAADAEFADSSDKAEHSETYNQESDVLEADIVKTDGEYIYYLYNDYAEDMGEMSRINIAHVQDGTVAETNVINISAFQADGWENSYSQVHDMYLYNDMLIVIGSREKYMSMEDDENTFRKYAMTDVVSRYSSDTFVNVYTTGINPQRLDSYCQDGYYNDVRITPDGFMYLITNYSSEDFMDIESEEDIECYIPGCLDNGEYKLLEADSIILPTNDDQIYSQLNYNVISGLDLNTTGEISEIDVKAVAGFSGSIYCSGDNLYTAENHGNTTENRYEVNTTINRYELNMGSINPAAAGKVNGEIKDQFSMSQYGDFFRIATTVGAWVEHNEGEAVYVEIEGRSNSVYILDMNLEPVGDISNFGEDEAIKSVNFSGDIAYVTTYEQTDPLFAIDLSIPENPVILDDLHMLGYSSYMQSWNENMLFGFGANADEKGIETGYKLSMFDNSDPENLSILDNYVIDRSDKNWLYSEAMWDRKALFIAPEKNLLGFPVEISHYEKKGEYVVESSYIFLSFEDGKFEYKGEFASSDNYGGSNLNRAIYIGDTVLSLSPHEIIFAPIDNLSDSTAIEF